ncbi:MAG: metallophosphatase family protein, partial [Meiothermus sp.]
MRLGILAEIHANLPALEAALEALRKEGISQI